MTEGCYNKRNRLAKNFIPFTVVGMVNCLDRSIRAPTCQIKS